MEVTITARHCTISDSLRDQTERVLRRFQRLHTRATSAVACFETESFEKSVEIRLNVGGGPPLIAHATGPTFRAALERGVDRLDRQVKRRRERWVQRRTAVTPHAAEPTSPPAEGAD
jgi:ribosomal subunit interface protein